MAAARKMSLIIRKNNVLEKYCLESGRLQSRVALTSSAGSTDQFLQQISTGMLSFKEITFDYSSGILAIKSTRNNKVGFLKSLITQGPKLDFEL